MDIAQFINMMWVLWNERNLRIIQKKRTLVQALLWRAVEDVKLCLRIVDECGCWYAVERITEK